MMGVTIMVVVGLDTDGRSIIIYSGQRTNVTFIIINAFIRRDCICICMGIMGLLFAAVVDLVKKEVK